MSGYTFCDTCGARDDATERGLEPNAILKASQGGYARGWSEANEYLKTEPFMLGDQLANALAEVERLRELFNAHVTVDEITAVGKAMLPHLPAMPTADIGAISHDVATAFFSARKDRT